VSLYQGTTVADKEIARWDEDKEEDKAAVDEGVGAVVWVATKRLDLAANVCVPIAGTR